MKKKLTTFLEAEKTIRRSRFLTKLSATLRTRAHLVMPAIANFWRADFSSEELREDVERSKVRAESMVTRPLSPSRVYDGTRTYIF